MNTLHRGDQIWILYTGKIAGKHLTPKRTTQIFYTDNRGGLLSSHILTIDPLPNASFRARFAISSCPVVDVVVAVNAPNSCPSDGDTHQASSDFLPSQISDRRVRCNRYYEEQQNSVSVSTAEAKIL